MNRGAELYGFARFFESRLLRKGLLVHPEECLELLVPQPQLLGLLIHIAYAV